jgi:hypothetical protein
VHGHFAVPEAIPRVHLWRLHTLRQQLVELQAFLNALKAAVARQHEPALCLRDAGVWRSIDGRRNPSLGDDRVIEQSGERGDHQQQTENLTTIDHS